MLDLLLLFYFMISLSLSVLMFGEYFDLAGKDPLMITGSVFLKALKMIFLFQYGIWYTLHDAIKPAGIFFLCVLITLLTWYASIFIAAALILNTIIWSAVWMFLTLFAYEDAGKNNKKITSKETQL